MTLPHSLFTDFDIALFKGGKHFRLYEKLGNHAAVVDGKPGTYFAVWAPNATKVSVIGNFNGWNRGSHKLFVRLDGSGIWEGFVSGVGNGDIYKYYILSNNNGIELEKGDPFAHRWEHPPHTASIVWDLENYKWKDQKWMTQRTENAGKPKPYQVYELHFESWRRRWEQDNRPLTYREMAVELVDYMKEMKFTHVEFMPIMEYPYSPSWGYQLTGYFAPSSRFGVPQDFMYLVDELHNAGVGVILDWVPSHFPEDAHGLGMFDGTHLYEHADPRKGFHPDWKSLIFNYGRFEVKSFLISNALFWLDKFHADGLRVDAVASMLYLDYSRKEGEWIPNEFGGRENLEAIAFLREMNETVYANYPGTETIAEESTAFAGVSRPTWEGGLGFGMKWMMGWMHDTLDYFKKDPIYRRFHQHNITFSMVYAFTENFQLPLSHDEVVHGKGSLLTRMPGDEWRKFANLRCMFGYMWTHPGHPMLFMGGEFGQWQEWDFKGQLSWYLLQYGFHQGVQSWVKALNGYRTKTPALWQKAFSPSGFEWVSMDDANNSILAYLRKGEEGQPRVLVVSNMSAQVLQDYKMGIAGVSTWKEVLNSDAAEFGGSGIGNPKAIKAVKGELHGRSHSISLTVAPLAVMIFEEVLSKPKAASAKAAK